MKTQKFRYVIVGNSTAAVAAVEGIRKTDTEGSIAVVGEEKHFVYGRPLISYYLLGATDAERMRYRPADFYEKMKVNAMLGVRAEKIDPAKKTVRLSDGRALGYEKLLVATGSRPFDPPMKGIESVRERFHFMTMDDALALEKALSPEKRVLIIGAGLIGLKCLEGIAARVKSVAVVDMAGRILPSILDEYGAAVVQRALEEKGAEFFLSDSVAEFESNAAHLQSGKTVPFDILVVAVGVRPNIELVKEAGGETGRGIAVDERSRTSLPDVYAAGDCTECFDVTSGQRKILALLPNAYLQGHCAGVNMAGGEEVFGNAAPFNSIGFFGTHVLTAGSYSGERYVEKGDNTYKVLFTADGVLKGFILVNLPERAGIYTSLVRGRTPLAEVDLSLLERAPELMAFSAGARREKLAREV